MTGEIKPEELALLKAGLSNLAELKQELATLKAENTQLRQQVTQQETKLNNLERGTATENSPTSRRRMLKKVGAAAASVVAAGVATTGLPNASATNGDTLKVGQSGNAAESTTLLFYDGANTAGPGSIFVVSDIQTTTTSRGFAAAVTGIATASTTGVKYGVYGYHGITGSPNPGGAGVVAVSDSPNGWGLQAKGGRANLYLENFGSAPASRSDAHFRGEILVDSTGALWYCVADGMPGIWRKIGGPGVQGNVNLLPAPDRFADTRDPNIGNQQQQGPFADPNDIILTIAGRTGRDGQTIPTSAVSILGNVTAITPVGSGLLKVLPSTVPRTQGTSTVNFNSGFNTANAFTSKLNNGQIKVAVAGTTSVHFTIDVVGYYM